MKLRVILFIAVAAGLTLLLFVQQQRSGPFEVSGFIEADEIRIGSRVGGRVAAVHVEEGQDVTKGDLLVELEPFDLQERRAQAAAQWHQAQAVHKKLSAGFRAEEIAQAQARVDQLTAELEAAINGPREQEIKAAAADLDLARAELERAEASFGRIAKLKEENASTEEQYERALADLRTARARVQERSENLALLKEGTREEDIAAARARLAEAKDELALRQNGYRDEEIAEAYAAVQAAEAALRVIDAQIEELTIQAPVDGRVEAVELQPGDLVGANTPVLSLMDMGRMWVRAYVPEDRLDVQIGQLVAVTVDSYPDERFRGEITFVAREAEFTPRNVQTPEERSRQVFRIKVTLLEGLDRLRPGMAADVHFEE
ncbi:HlyD family efflux transporter periplasmic adaptor subunit [Maioricimonas sp. JC845]|uniref:HlyD family secretion protein n=1 Tax=Maioricimonas sp. JC845 TaxID=3232138 RepID=UPI00345AF4FC